MEALDGYRAQARYNAWFNARLYEVSATASDDERRRDLGAFFGSVHGTLNHLILCDHIWLLRLQPDLAEAIPRDAAGKAIQPAGLDSIVYDDFDLLRARRTQLDATIQRWIASLSPADLDREMAYKTTKGVAVRHPLWWAVTHMFNHQTHHRGQVTTLLLQLGHDPGATDLLVMLREEQAAAS
jgi:uncharacterized damage-inducible protein DinB